MAEVRLCAFCDQPVTKMSDGKDWTTREETRDFRHTTSSVEGVANCGRQYLATHETYTEGDVEQ